MAALEPADSGGASNDRKMLPEDILNYETTGSWAKMMEEEELNKPDVEPVNPAIEEKLNRVPNSPPFLAQVTNCNISNQDEEEFFYFFGGPDEISDFNIDHESCKAYITFHKRDGLVSALKKHESDFRGAVIKVFVDRRDTVRDARPHQAQQQEEHLASEEEQYHRGGGSGGGYRQDRYYQNDRRPYNNHHDDRGHYNRNHRDGHYSSQSSMNESQYSDYGHHRQRNQHDNYRGNRNDYNNYNNKYNNNRRGGRYDRGNYGGDGRHQSDFQRSNSYQNYNNKDRDYHHPAAVNRSRTDSHYYDRDSRASSRMSEEPVQVLQQQQQPVQPVVVKKPSVNPFGNAKPVDTQAKLLEIERKLAEKQAAERAEKLAREEAAAAAAAEAAALAAQAAQAQQAEETVTDGGQNHKRHFGGKDIRQQQYGGGGGHHHGGHNRYNNYQQYQQPHTGPGSVQIRKREQPTDRDVANVSPPIDPVQHPIADQPIATNPQSPLVQEKDETDGADAHPHPPHPHQRMYSDRGHKRGDHRGQRHGNYVPRGAHQLQRSATAGNIGENQQDASAPINTEGQDEAVKSVRGSTRGRGRGAGRGSLTSRQERRASISNLSEKTDKDSTGRKISGSQQGRRGGYKSRGAGRIGAETPRDSADLPPAPPTSAPEAAPSATETAPTKPTPPSADPAPAPVAPQPTSTEVAPAPVADGSAQSTDAVDAASDAKQTTTSSPTKKEKKKNSKKKKSELVALRGNRFAALHQLGDEQP